MKKILLFMFGICLIFTIKFSSQAAFEYDKPETVDNSVMVIVKLGTLEGRTSKKINKLSALEIENCFWEDYKRVQYESDIDADLWNWFLNSPNYTTQQKFDTCNTTVATSNILFYWILLNDEISLENKVQYFRTHSIRYTDDNIKNWWWINIGSNLTVANVNPTDSHNWEWYRRALYGSSDANLKVVHIDGASGGSCYMDLNDIEECIKKGTIRVENRTYSLGSSTSTYNKYYSKVGYNTGYMMWRLE